MEANLQRSVAKWSPFRSAAYPTRFRCVTVTAGPRQPSKQQEDVKDVVVRRLDRRALLASVGAAVALSTGNSGALAEVQEGIEEKSEKMEKALRATPQAAAEGMKLYYGFASPPTSYGGYGGNATEDPKYYFSYPENWKIETPNKVKKGMQGIDAIVYEKKGKGYPNVFVITFSRAGEDNKSFKLNTDVESTLQGFAGADYDLQDALGEATDTSKASRELDGETYYDYSIETPSLKYLATVTVQTGKVFALFVKAPNKVWEEQGERLNIIQQSFRTIPASYKRSGPE